MAGVKHLIQCHCILPQFRNLEEPVFHQFVVFSNTDDKGDIVVKIAKCNNCGVVHRVVDFCKSEIVTSAEDTMAITTIEDLKNSIPEKMCKVLIDSKSDISTWEQVDDIIENESWNSSIVLSREKVGDETHLKVMSIIGPERFRIKTHTRQEFISGDLL